jgi:hypothetical protein
MSVGAPLSLRIPNDEPAAVKLASVTPQRYLWFPPPPETAVQLNQKSTVKLPAPSVKSALSGVVTRSPVPSNRPDAVPNLRVAVLIFALPAAVHVCAAPPALLSVNVVDRFVPSKCSSIFVDESLPPRVKATISLPPMAT